MHLKSKLHQHSARFGQPYSFCVPFHDPIRIELLLFVEKFELKLNTLKWNCRSVKSNLSIWLTRLLPCGILSFVCVFEMMYIYIWARFFFFTHSVSSLRSFIETDYQINQPMYNCLIDREKIPVWWVKGNQLIEQNKWTNEKALERESETHTHTRTWKKREVKWSESQSKATE